MLMKIVDILYHGTISKLENIDVTKGRDNKDFGKGFYMAVSKNQAIGMMHKKFKENINRIENKKIKNSFCERLYEIKIDTNYAKLLNVKIFETANMDWLDFVLKCREKGGVPHDYDLVIGPTADDNTLLCLRAYWQGFYGIVNSSRAKQVLLENLETQNLGIQYFIGKQNIADKLIIFYKEISWE